MIFMSGSPLPRSIQVTGCISYNPVYSAGTSIADAVAYMLGPKDKYEDVALLLHSVIQRTFKEKKSRPWPPSADDLEVKS